MRHEQVEAQKNVVKFEFEFCLSVSLSLSRREFVSHYGIILFKLFILLFLINVNNNDTNVWN